MPKTAMETAGGDVLDGEALRKLKQHNRHIYQQKKQDALVLRQKLEQWKEEKKKAKEEQKKQKLEQWKEEKKKTKEEQKKQKLEQWKEEKKKTKEEQKKPFVTTVSKPVPPKPLNVQLNKPRKPVSVSTKVLSKTTIGQPAGKPVKTVAAKVKPKSQTMVRGQNVREKENQKPAGTVRGRLSTTSRHTDRPKGPVTCKAVPQGHTNHPRGVVTTKAPPQGSKPPVPEMTTPLSRNKNTGFGKRHTIAYLTKGMKEGKEMVRPVSLAEELQAASVADIIPKSTMSQPSSDLSAVDGKLADITGHVEELPNEETGNTSVLQSKTKGTSRDSLTARFRKSKRLSNPLRKSSAGAAPEASPHSSRGSAANASRKSVHTSRPSNCKPRKSILKRTSIAVRASSEVGASPVLPSSKPRQNQVKVISSKTDRRAPLARQSADDKAKGTPTVVPSSSHVVFATNTEKGEGAHYRKTPGKAKTQDYMRTKLNEWLTAKGRTPLHLRHTPCFHSHGEGSQWCKPRSQIKASMSLEQLSQQEKTLTREDLQSVRKRLEWTGRKRRPLTRRSSPSLPMTTTRTPGSALICTETNLQGSEAGAGEAVHSPDDRGEARCEAEETQCGDAVGSTEREEAVVSPRKRASSSPMTAGSGPSSVAAGSLDLCTGSTEQLQAECHKCLTALDSGLLRAEEALEWLDKVSQASQDVWGYAPWYRCKVAALKQLGDEDGLLATFEQAILHNAQPARDMAQLLTATMKELLSEQTAQNSRPAAASSARRISASKRRSRCSGQVVQESEVQAENMFQSTTVRFSVTEVTPFKKRRRATDMEEKLVSVVTPVRRSARLSSTGLGSASKGRQHPGTPHVAEYSALEEVPSAEKERMLFLPNRALDTLLIESSPEVREKDTSCMEETPESEVDTSAETVAE